MAAKLVLPQWEGEAIEIPPAEFIHLSADKNDSALLLVTYKYGVV